MNTETTKLNRKKLRHKEYYDVMDIQDKLYELSKKGHNFNNLLELIEDENNIMLAYRNIKNNKGSHTKGTDGKTIKSLALLSNEDLIEVVRKKLKNYRPQSVRRVLIPKPDGKMRPLGIPTIKDRLVQQCILQILEPICEAKFYKQSYGFRPMRSAKKAIARAYYLTQINGLHHVIDIDIKGFFDNIKHSKLLKQIWHLGIRDKNLISIISKMLKAEIEGEGKSEKGTPQGGILSPLLSNIVLNELDWWIASQWDKMPTKRPFKPQLKGRDNRIQGLQATRLKEMHIVRYADDFKIFCRTQEQANKVFHAITKWLKERLDLEISDEKSKIVNLKKNYSNFLGIKFKANPKGWRATKIPKRKYVVKSHICDKSKTKIIGKIREYAKLMQKPPNNNGNLQVMKHNSYVIGVHNYYNCATHCSKDFHDIASKTRTTLKNRLKLSKKYVECESYTNGYIVTRYNNSKQIRFAYNTPIAPIGYIQHEIQNQYNGLSIYIEEDRIQMHKNLIAISESEIRYMLNNPVPNRSSEYNDNRISKFVSQHGKCFITKQRLEANNFHCHHIVPRANNGKDEFNNLLILHPDIHKLIHAKDLNIINDIIFKHKLTDKMLDKINKLKSKLS